jgi:carboxyl-terminal processing protease
LTDLIEIAKNEGLEQRANSEFEALKSKLTPDINESMAENKADITELLSLEIIKRYYFQKGEVQFSLRNDVELKIAIELLRQGGGYSKFLNPTQLSKLN